MRPALPMTADIALRLGSSPLAVLLDIDGTLAQIAPRPEQAFVPPATCRAISALSDMPGVHVAIVTGRSVEDARRLVGLPHLGVIGNHGFEVLGESGELISEPAAHTYLDAMRVAIGKLNAMSREIPGVVVEDKKWTLSIHYRLAARPDIPRIADVVHSVGRELGLAVTRGKEVLELRPPMTINKGTASVLFARKIGTPTTGSALYIGDDRTDEDAFRALREEFAQAVTVRVGDPEHGEETFAEFRVETTDEVRRFLEAVTGVRRGDSPLAA